MEQKPKILAVDDEDRNLQLLEAFLIASQTLSGEKRS